MLSIFVFVILFKFCYSGNLPLVINTWKFIDAANSAWITLNQREDALEALQVGCMECERSQCDGTVGYGGSPDENGETTLDALIIDGFDMNVGAVAGLREIKSAIEVAKHVLQNTEHSILVGESATHFAEMMGFTKESLITKNSTEIWKNWKNSRCQPNFWTNVEPNPKQNCGPYKPKRMKLKKKKSSKNINCQVNFLNDVIKIKPSAMHFQKTRNGRNNFHFGQFNHDTIGMIVIDRNGKIFAGTSTNGARHKIPGRVGDSPIPGAGAYADNEVGAAAATGDGDIMLRFLPSFLAVESLRLGKTPQEAASIAMHRIMRFYPHFTGAIIVADRFGNYSASCSGMQTFPFSVASGKNEKNAKIEYVKCII